MSILIMFKEEKCVQHTFCVYEYKHSIFLKHAIYLFRVFWTRLKIEHNMCLFKYNNT